MKKLVLFTATIASICYVAVKFSKPDQRSEAEKAQARAENYFKTHGPIGGLTSSDWPRVKEGPYTGYDR